MKSILCTDVELIRRKTEKTRKIVNEFEAVIPKELRHEIFKFKVCFISKGNTKKILNGELIQQVMLALNEIKFQ